MAVSPVCTCETQAMEWIHTGQRAQAESGFGSIAQQRVAVKNPPELGFLLS